MKRKKKLHKIRQDGELKLRLDSRLKSKIQEVAASEGMTLSAYLRHMVKTDLKERNIEWKAA